MRALCESCSRPQPVDWRAGDRCVWCGEAVRRELRCFWCAKWTPAGKYCRHCGAATVEPQLYGAARMIKDAGTDRFTVPKLLHEFEPDQIENFTRIYQEHAAVAENHIAQMVFLESHLEQRHWSSALADELTAELPWPDPRLDQMRKAARCVPMHLDGLEKAKAIGEHSPCAQTRSLAVIARVALEDWDAIDSALSSLDWFEETMRWEAALALTHWRVVYGPRLPYGSVRRLIPILQSCPLRESAAIRLALLGEPVEVPLPPGDFGVALATGDVDSLTAAARDSAPVMQYAAAQKLIELGVLTPVAQVLCSATRERQEALLRQLQLRKKPAPDLRGALFELAENSRERDLVRMSCEVLCIGCDPADAIRIAHAGKGDRTVYQSLLQRAALLPESLRQLGAFLIEQGSFTADQWGLGDIAKSGRMPADFVPRQWPAADDGTRAALCRFAEMQLGEYGDPSLHRFLVEVALTPAASGVEVQSAAWSSLYRWYDSFGYPRRRPLKVGADEIRDLFGSAENFLTRLEGFLRGRKIFYESIHRDRIVELLRYTKEDARPSFEELPDQTLVVANAVADLMREPDLAIDIRIACGYFLSFVGSSGVFRAAMIGALRSFIGTDMDLHANQMLALLERESFSGTRQ